MQQVKDTIVLRWAWWVLTAVAVLWAAHMFRWAAMPGEDFVWDRWRHRLCELTGRDDGPGNHVDIAVYPTCSVPADTAEIPLQTVLAK
ncbi:MAG: hypothetical protein AMS20_15295 [Gemmatimonas sp. SG8_28]|nr:MAG: hypothetical protein AMS20_15295 [Gemmatimonas sp. SG8_28]